MTLPKRILMALLIGVLGELTYLMGWLKLPPKSEMSDGWWRDLERSDSRKGWDGPYWPLRGGKK
jgi:hypothetical protein